jgi:hypothetical protein
MKIASLLALVLGALATNQARADDETGAGIQRVGVVRLEFEGNVSETGREMFAQRLAAGLTVARFEVLSGAKLREKLRSGDDACADQSCYPRVARSLGVGYIVVGQVLEQSKTYQIALELINGRTGATLATLREQCETCGIEEAGEKMDLAASALRARLQAVTRMPARFIIRSQPVEARASIDGKAVGRTPLDLELAGGEHHLALELGGHDPLHRTFIVVSGVDETLDFDLVSQPTTFPYRMVGWAGVTAGTLAIAAGVIALVVNGNEVSCTATVKDDGGHCPFIRKTDVLGASLLGLGSAALTVGGVSLYLGTRGGLGNERASSVPPFAVAYRGRF